MSHDMFLIDFSGRAEVQPWFLDCGPQEEMRLPAWRCDSWGSQIYGMQRKVLYEAEIWSLNRG